MNFTVIAHMLPLLFCLTKLQKLYKQNWHSFSVVKATALEQQISKFYQQI